MSRRRTIAAHLARAAGSPLAVAVLAALACGDNALQPDAAPEDAPRSIPDPPQIGAQIDRMGRPVLVSALVGTFFDPPDTAAAKREAYTKAPDPATWAGATIGGRTIAAELATNLAVFDALDKGNQMIPTTGGIMPGCKNQAIYNGNPNGGGAAGPNSYQRLSNLLADDMIYVDTSFPTCAVHLALELDAVSGTLQHTECGGRAPTHDVGDYLVSFLISGLHGFTPAAAPRFSDGVPRREDLSDTQWPYFGPPR